MKGSKPASNRDGSPVFDHCKDSLKETRVSFTRVSFTVQDGSWGKLKHEFMGVAASGAVVGGITSLLMNTRAYMEGELGVKELVKTVARDAAAGGAAAGTSYCIVRGCMYTITITCQSLMTDAVKASVQKAISEIVEHAGWDSDVSAFFFEAASDAARLTVQVAKGDVSTWVCGVTDRWSTSRPGWFNRRTSAGKCLLQVEVNAVALGCFHAHTGSVA